MKSDPASPLAGTLAAQEPEFHLQSAGRFKFNFPHLRTLVLVEKGEEGIVVRATRDTFSPERQESFIRELAAEGFIPDHFRWFSAADLGARRRARWLVDPRWLKSAEDRAIRRIATGFLIAVPLLWMGWTMFLRFTGR
jgi:hypothetical protein